MALVEEAEAEVIVGAAIVVVMAAVIVGAAIVAVTAEVIVGAAIVAVTAAVIVGAAIVAVTAAAILNLITLILISLLEQKVGKTEAMEILLKILNMKAVGAGEKGESQMREILQTRQIRNPFLSALTLI